MSHGTFTISLDFELLWGIFDKVGNDYSPRYFQNTRQIIPDMLQIFAKNEIHATWATVGMLFAENEEEWTHYSPVQTPSYRKAKLSPYAFVKNHGLTPQVHFAPDLIKLILDTPGQELGSHTYAHYYTLERGQSPEQFRRDLETTQKIAGDKFGIRMTSLVFPRNHINELYLPICLEVGYKQVRSNPKSWFWQETQHEEISKKWFRAADCFIPVGKCTSYPIIDLQHYANEPLLIPASRILKPISKNNKLFNNVRLRRVKSEMEYAAKNNRIYHLWWHPHNFANDPIQAMTELDEIMELFRHLKHNYGMQSMNMEEVGGMIYYQTLK